MGKILEWCANKVKLYGVKKFSICVGAIICFLLFLHFLWGLEKDVNVESMGMGTTLSEPRELSVIRTGKISDGFSLMSISKDLASGISSETEVMSTFDELLSLSKDVNTKKEKLVIPDKAGYSELGDMELYMWKRSGKHFLTGAEFSEIHVVFLYGGQYIEGSMDANLANVALGTNLQVGKLN